MKSKKKIIIITVLMILIVTTIFFITTFNEPVNILLLGGDEVNKNTDTIMLLNFNPRSSNLSILSIPRDTKVKINGLGTAKINAAYPYGGSKVVVDAVSSLLKVNIKYIIYVDTSAFRNIIDILGGVDYNVPVNLDYDDPIQNLHIHLKKGMQHLDGAKAEQFMRFRQSSHYTAGLSQYYDGSDLKRIDAQQDFMKAIIKQKLNIFSIAKTNQVFSVILSKMETNMHLNDVIRLLPYASKVDVNHIQTFKLPGSDSNESSGWYYSMDSQKTAEIIKQHFQTKATLINAITPSKTQEKPTQNSTGTKAQKTPVEAPKVVPVIAPVEVPKEVPTDVPVEVPANAPVEVQNEESTVIPTEAPSETTKVIPEDSPKEVPTMKETQTPVINPQDTPSVNRPNITNEVPTNTQPVVQ